MECTQEKLENFFNTKKANIEEDILPKKQKWMAATVV
jgi:hypothetical protein